MTTEPPPFDLEPSTPSGHVPMRVVDELRILYRNAKARAVTFRDAIKGQAEKHGVEPVALRRYVVALESDTVERIQAELDDLLKLLDDDAE